MTQLTQEQVDTLKNKGLTIDKIQAIAMQRGYEMPKQSLGSALIKSEKGFGQSIAGAIGGTVGLGGTKTAIDEANQRTQQVQTNLINTIKDKRAKGEDTSRLVNALKTLEKEVNFYDILNTSTGGSLDKSAKQVFGEAAGVATDILGAGALPGGVGAMTKATTIGGGIIKGAKAGAVGGAIFGTAQGASRAAQENLTGGEIVAGGIKGGIAGGVAGGVIGGAIGGVSGAIGGRQIRKMNKEEKFALDLVSPKATPTIKGEALAQGRVTEAGLFKPSKITASKRDVQIADSVKGFVSSKKTDIQNIDALKNTVSSIDDNVTGYIVKNKTPFNAGQLKTRLVGGKDDLRLIFASDKTAENTYNAVVDEFMRNVSKKDTAGLFQARKTFDRIPAIKKLLETDKLGENARKEIVLVVRRAANEYIASQLPKGNQYRDLLMKESHMLEAIGNIAQKNIGTIDKNKLQLLTIKYPILKWIIGGTAAGALGAGGVGVGSSIIGSTN